MGVGDVMVFVVCDYSFENEIVYFLNVVVVLKLEVDYILEKVVWMDLEFFYS